MKRLFDDNSKYNAVGNQVDLEVADALRPIIRKWADYGYCPRDLQSVSNGAVLDLVLNILLELQKPV